MDTTDNWNALMLAVYEECTAEEAIEAFGLRMMKHKWGRPKKAEGGRWNKAEIMRIREMRSKKVSWKKIGELFGVNQAAVYRAFYKYGPRLLDDWQPGKE